MLETSGYRSTEPRPEPRLQSPPVNRMTQDLNAHPGQTHENESLMMETVSIVSGTGSSLSSRIPKATASDCSDNREYLYQSVYRKTKIRLLSVLIPVVMLSVIGKVMCACAAYQRLKSLDLSDSDLDFATYVYYLSHSLFCLPGLWLAKRMTMRIWLSCVMVLWGGLTMAMAAVDTRGHLVIIRLLLGAADASIQPIVYAYIDLYFQPIDVAEVWAKWFLSAIVAAMALTLPIMKFLTGSYASFGVLAIWQWAFVITGITGVTAGLVVFLFLLEHPSKTTVLTQHQKIFLSNLKSRWTCTNEIDNDASSTILPFFHWKTAHLGAMGILHNGMTVCFPFFAPGIINIILSQTGNDRHEEALGGTIYLSLLPAICTMVMLHMIASVVRNSAEQTRNAAGVGILVASIFLALLWPSVYQPTSSPVAAFVFLCVLQSITISFAAILDSLPALHLQMDGAAPGYFAALSALRSLSPIFSPVLFANLINAFGGGAALAINAFCHLLGLLGLYIWWCCIRGNGFCRNYRHTK